MRRLMRFLRDEEGVTALEYALIAALIACFIIGAVTFAGQQVSAVFQFVGEQMGIGMLGP